MDKSNARRVVIELDTEASKERFYIEQGKYANVRTLNPNGSVRMAGAFQTERRAEISRERLPDAHKWVNGCVEPEGLKWRRVTTVAERAPAKKKVGEAVQDTQDIEEEIAEALERAII